MVESEQSVPSGDVMLAGTLCLPDGAPAKACVLLVHGSGPLDRNESSPTAPLEVFNALAHHSASQGIASFRYDKRGCGESTGHYLKTGLEDLLDDALACVDWLRARQETDSAPLFIFGHSEGTIIAARVSALRSMAGVVLLMPFLEPFEKLVERQLLRTLSTVRATPGIKGAAIRFLLWCQGNQLKKQRRAMRKIRHSTTDTLKLHRQTINARWVRELMALSPPDIMRAVPSPVLAIGGEKDIQCAPNDVLALRELVSVPLDTHVLPDMTHVLRRDTEPASLARYRVLFKRPVDAELLGIVATWIEKYARGTDLLKPADPQ